MIRVLVVDDSGFFRRRVSEMLESDPQIEVVGTAENGLEAISKARLLKPDVITMDIEMPVMDGISATRKLSPQGFPIIMFSSLSHEGAKATLEALDAGAVDFLPKRFEDISKDRVIARRALCEKVKSVTSHRGVITRLAPGLSANSNASRKVPLNSIPKKPRQPYSLVAIGASTGGPVALQQVLSGLPVDYPSPILLIMHMPAAFTKAFAERLDSVCPISVREAKDGDTLQPGLALLAPGGQQTQVRKLAGRLLVKLTQASPDQNYKPCIDISFNSIAKALDPDVLAIVLTGMGADGCDGARNLKAGGGSVWAQDKASSVIYGMPAAVIDAGLADCVLSLGDIGGALVKIAA